MNMSYKDSVSWRMLANSSAGWERCAPKAKVTSSNLVGRANKINGLRRSFRKSPKGRLTTNSPTEQAYWRVIGGHFVTLLP
jgi:hypothetical protein